VNVSEHFNATLGAQRAHAPSAGTVACAELLAVAQAQHASEVMRVVGREFGRVEVGDEHVRAQRR
jgi:hypothetical protein